MGGDGAGGCKSTNRRGALIRGICEIVERWGAGCKTTSSFGCLGFERGARAGVMTGPRGFARMSFGGRGRLG